MATKLGQTTLRPFIRVDPRDLLIYQSLVDAMRDQIEAQLPSRDVAFAYRLSSLDKDDPFEGTPRFSDFSAATDELCARNLGSYLIETDVSSFFIGVDIDELQLRLLEAGCHGDVVRDLGALLHAWRSAGVRGLPQGLAPSSVLGNFYLASIDQLFEDLGARHIRFMDDIKVLAPSYHDARRFLDTVEEHLYEMGLSLGGAKTAISRTTSVVSRSTPESGLEDLAEALRGLGDYAPDEIEIEEAQLDQVKELFDGAVDALSRDEYRRSHLIFAMRFLARTKDAHAIPKVSDVVLRMPGLTASACGYLSKLAGPGTRAEVAAALLAMTQGRFNRTQEWLHILRTVLVVGDRDAMALCPTLEELAENHDHPLVRARAILAWGRQSAEEDFSAADRYFSEEDREWLAYAVVAIQGKASSGRESRFESWSGEGRSLARLIREVREQPFAWNKI